MDEVEQLRQRVERLEAVVCVLVDALDAARPRAWQTITDREDAEQGVAEARRLLAED